MTDPRVTSELLRLESKNIELKAEIEKLKQQQREIEREIAATVKLAGEMDLFPSL